MGDTRRDFEIAVSTLGPGAVNVKGFALTGRSEMTPQLDKTQEPRRFLERCRA
jgi:hypothetical protein